MQQVGPRTLLRDVLRTIGADLPAKLLEKESYIESLETIIEHLKDRLSVVEEKLALREEAKDEADKEVIKLSDELRENESRLEMLSKET